MNYVLFWFDFYIRLYKYKYKGLFIVLSKHDL